ncbi:hypothetical protein NE237_030262 [Protea cynaroides]|uniref:Uncharacterized protein n=1 Tax=Protea cynaroides TaxID=273540 RepID=A0A9Q0GTW0_9MAGN|nr:hypothetical protein NE237_030262 [Protea cynaroides]
MAPAQDLLTIDFSLIAKETFISSSVKKVLLSITDLIGLWLPEERFMNLINPTKDKIVHFRNSIKFTNLKSIHIERATMVDQETFVVLNSRSNNNGEFHNLRINKQESTEKTLDSTSSKYIDTGGACPLGNSEANVLSL